MARVQQLVTAARLTPPADPFDWSRTERRIGAPVPQDYRDLLDGGGGGLWADVLRLFVPAPGAGFKHVDLERSRLEFEQLQDLFEDEVVERPEDLGDEDRLLPWASTGSGLTFYWQVAPGADPETYPVRVSDRNGYVWERYDLPTTDLVLQIVEGELRSELVDPSWVNRDQLFQPYQRE